MGATKGDNLLRTAVHALQSYRGILDGAGGGPGAGLRILDARDLQARSGRSIAERRIVARSNGWPPKDRSRCLSSTRRFQRLGRSTWIQQLGVGALLRAR